MANTRLPTIAGENKECYLCAQIKPVDAFAKKRNGYDSRCKQCRNKQFKERYRKKRSAKKRYRETLINQVAEVYVRSDERHERFKQRQRILADLVLEVLSERFGNESDKQSLQTS